MIDVQEESGICLGIHNIGFYRKYRRSTIELHILQLASGITTEVRQKHVGSTIRVCSDNTIPSLSYHLLQTDSLLHQLAGTFSIHITIIDDIALIYDVTSLHILTLVAIRSIEFGSIHRVVVGTVSKAHGLTIYVDNTQSIIDIHPVGIHGEELRTITLLVGHTRLLILGIVEIERTLGSCHFVGTDSHQTSLILGNGGSCIGTHIIGIDDSITWSRIDGETIVEGSVVHIQFSVHRITVATEIIDAADYRCGICTLAAYLITTEEVTSIVLTVRYDHLVLIRTVGSDVSGITALTCTP